MTKALIAVDVQNDFTEGGALPVPGGSAVAERIAEWVLAHKDDYAVVVATQDYHEAPGSHFASAGEEPDFRATWPEHCAVGTAGADFHPNLRPALPHVERIFRKGRFEAAYSGFEAADDEGRSLGDYLRAAGVSEVEVVGLATDYCVKETALDARREGFATTVLLDLTAAVAPETGQAALQELESAGVHVTRATPA